MNYKPARDRKSRVIGIRVTLDEWRFLKQRAKEHRCSVAEMVRRIGLNTYPARKAEA